MFIPEWILGFIGGVAFTCIASVIIYNRGRK